MRTYALLFPVAMLFAMSTAASAQVMDDAVPAGSAQPPGDDHPPEPADPTERPAAAEPVGRARSFEPHFVIDTGRAAPAPTDPTTMGFTMHGEFQLRYRANNDLPLRPPVGQPSVNELGQNHYLYNWMRVRPRFRYRDVLEVVGEFDFPRGVLAGQTTQAVTAARDDYGELQPFEFHPRKLYVQYVTPIGMFRVGHQMSHWGMGILANDGDHPSLFGDYRRGAVVERMLFATKPLGRDGPLVVALAGDLVFEDPRALLIDPDDSDRRSGDRALQAVAAVRLEGKNGNIGVYGVLRDQRRTDESVNSLSELTEKLQVGVVDVAGSFRAPVPGTDVFAFGEAEAAFIAGTTNYVRNIELTRHGEDERVESFGGALALGAVRVAHDAHGSWGDFVARLEWGYATGDADPFDGTTRRFNFNQNHNVGLVLFDHVLAWKTARSATAAQDPGLVARDPPGLDFLPTEGAIFGASYLYPTMVVRPKRWLDLKAGMVIAQTTADFVDPFAVGALGDYANYDGGDENRHDLGLELDAGVDVRIPLAHAITVQAGVDGGVLLPGSAFDDASGERMDPQFLLNSKLGLQY
jgi:hypothetical protein